ncbi:lysyltRNA synthetase putative [Cunninghamella echinulata]|nr:lysyltRNA synthetase putative [Cunninghamella echinulata]
MTVSTKSLTRLLFKSGHQYFTIRQNIIRSRPFSSSLTRTNNVERKNHYPRFQKAVNEGKYINIIDMKQQESLLKNGEKSQDIVTLTGRIMSKRESSGKLVFYDIMHHGESIQVVASKNRFDQPELFADMNRTTSRGDIFAFTGVIGKTNHGQLSLFTNKFRLLTPCLHDLPKSGLKDPEKRFRQRYLDMLVNPEPLKTLKTRSHIIRFIRQFLDKRDFLEVETPILASAAGGASARPFITKANSLNMDMQLRIAPELYLKQLVIGGVDRVFEIGKQFRNEGIDADHNPEFTTCEFYQAYGNLEGLMKDTETMLSEMVQYITNSKIITKGNIKLDFGSPFQRINVVEYLDNYFKLDNMSSIATMNATSLRELCKQHQIPHIQPPYTEARLLDKIISHLIEPKCIQPTFLYHHPLSLSPLAKDIEIKNGIRVAARFELFVAKKEIVNAYEELNDPKEQRIRFEKQLNDRQQGDIEAPIPDMEFCEALEYGLPPTAGWGMGIDRVVQLLTDSHHIREVIAFPVMRPLDN